MQASRSLCHAEVVAFLASCASEGGGYGGGPGQLAHLAVAYAAVATLVTLGAPEALDSVDRRRMWSFLVAMCRSPAQGGGMHVCAGQ